MKGLIDAFATLKPQLNKPEIVLRDPCRWEQEQLPLQHQNGLAPNLP
jgi:hypothetical protein